jgi:hypothetical protein
MVARVFGTGGLSFSLIFATAIFRGNVSLAQTRPSEIQSDPKIVGLRDAIRSAARDSILLEEAKHGKPVQISYDVTIDPRPTGHDEMWGEIDAPIDGVPISTGFLCSDDTFANADIACVFGAILGADGQMRTDMDLYFWTDGHWITDAEAELRQIDKLNPSVGKQLREQMEEIKRLSEHPPSTRPAPYGSK